MIPRPTYLSTLHQYRDKPLIKVLTGVRRSGKSTILQMFRDDLITLGYASDDQTISINFEDMANRNLLTAESLYNHLHPLTTSKNRLYLFLDEIQHVSNFEQVIDSLHIQPGVDLYITGSNARLLKTDLATMLTGRYIEIRVYPLSFAEFVTSYAAPPDLLTAYDDYITFGSFPEAVNLFHGDKTAVSLYLQGVFNTIIYNDIVARYGVRDDMKLQAVARYLFDNIGNITNPKRAADALTNSGQSTTNHTVTSYINAMAESYLIYTANRFDVRGKQILQTNQKHYLVDTALRRLLADTTPSDYGRVLENVVYLELLRRHDKVWIGKSGNAEIDFVTRDNLGDTQMHYYQVALSVRDSQTRKRELKTLRATDNYPKTLLTLDSEEGSHDGIVQRNVLKWLTEPR